MPRQVPAGVVRIRSRFCACSVCVVMRARTRMQRAALVRPVRQVIDVDPYLPQPELASLVDLQQDTAGKPMLGTPPVELGSLPHEAVSVAPASASAAQVMPGARVYTPLHRVSFCARASVSPHATLIATVLSLLHGRMRSHARSGGRGGYWSAIGRMCAVSDGREFA